MIILERYDDLDYARDKTKTLATHHEVQVTWKGRPMKVDLGDENYDALAAILDPLAEAARKAELTPQGRARPGQGKQRRRGRKANGYYDGLRAWADENHLVKRDDSGRPAYEGARPGRFDYPDWLIADYDEYLAAQDTAA